MERAEKQVEPHLAAGGRRSSTVPGNGFVAPDERSRSVAKPMTNTWESLHLFYHHGSDDSDALLLDAIAPTLNDAQRRGDVSSWFFIRYWEGGPHFRIRFRDPRPTTVDGIRRTLADYLATQTHGEPPLEPSEYYESFGPNGGDPLAAQEWYADHTIAGVPYVPEVGRYGGLAGLALSEEMFASSTQAAVAGIRLSPGRGRRLDLALSTLLTTVLGLGLDPMLAVGWLRGFVTSFSFATETAGLPTGSLRLHAEREFFSKSDDCLKRLRAVEREVAEGRPESSLICWWNRQVRRFAARYEEADGNGVLSVPPLQILQSQLHMLHNRLGVSISDECYLAWMTSLIIARADGSGGFFDDGLTAPDRRYHEQSKYFATSMASQSPKPDFEEAPTAWRPGVPIPLPLVDRPAMALDEVLIGRRSTRRLFGPITLADLSGLLRLAGGSSGTVVSGRKERRRFRTYPSPGAKYPTAIVLYARDVAGLAPGLFVYDAEEHVLRPVGPAIDDDRLFGLSPYTAEEGNPAAVNAREIPLWVFLVADFSRLRPPYGARSYRLVALECGHLAQNICLVATAQGMATMPIGGFYDDDANQALLIDGVNQSVLYMILVGNTQPEGHVEEGSNADDDLRSAQPS